MYCLDLLMPLAVATATDSDVAGKAASAATNSGWAVLIALCSMGAIVVPAGFILWGKLVDRGGKKDELAAGESKAERESYKSIIAARDETIRGYDQRIAAINTTQIAQARQIGSLESQVENLNKRDAEHMTRIGEQNALIADLTKRLTEATTALAAMRNEYAHSQSLLAAEQAENATNTALNERMNARMTAAEASVARLAAERNDLATRLAKAEAELNNLTARSAAVSDH